MSDRLVVVGVALASAVLGFLLFRAAAPVEQSSPVPPFGAPVIDAGVGELFPDVAFGSPSSSSLQVADFDGQVRLVNYWATWCPPCVKEVPDLQRLFETYRERGFVVIGVALDEPAKADAFLRELAVTYPSVTDRRNAVLVMQQLGNKAGALPFSVIVDRSGTVREARLGVITEADAAKLIEPYL